MEVPGIVHGPTLVSDGGLWSSAWSHTRGILVMEGHGLVHGLTLVVF